MYKTIKSIVMLILVMLPFMSQAQDQSAPPRPQHPAPGQQMRRPPEDRAERQTEWMSRNLSISNEQRNQVHDIMLQHAREMDKAMDKHTDMKAINEKRDKDLQAVLTPDQFQKFKQHEAEMKEKRQQGKPGEGGNQ